MEFYLPFLFLLLLRELGVLWLGLGLGSVWGIIGLEGVIFISRRSGGIITRDSGIIIIGLGVLLSLVLGWWFFITAHFLFLNTKKL